MNHNTYAALASSEPRRSLRADFTVHTMHHAVIAKQRAAYKQQFRAFFKEPFSMKSLTFLRTAPGAAVAVAILATTGASTYALANWFNTSVTVTQSNSILSVDLSECKGTLPPGIEPGTDRTKVQFKILGNPHISAADLQRQTLVDCEYQAVIAFYNNQPNTTSASFHMGKVTAIDSSTIRLAYQWGGKTNEKTFSLTSSSTFYNQGSPVTLRGLQAGDNVVFVTQNQSVQEGIDPLAVTNEVLSVFKTRYNPAQAMSASKNGFYEDNNVMPLNMYNQLHR